jgi:hypothetical protein
MFKNSDSDSDSDIEAGHTRSGRIFREVPLENLLSKIMNLLYQKKGFIVERRKSY